MGQRHQAFLIARLTLSTEGEQTKPRYRCIAALHHQWCYGRLPLSATRRFLNLLKNPDNAEIIRDELRRAHGKYGRQGETPPIIRDSAFPYTQFLFVQAFNMDIDNPFGAYASGVGLEGSLLNPNVGCFEHMNDDGITIIDVTDPLDPAYCFSMHNGRILDAKRYARRYFEEGEEDEKVENDLQCHLASLEDERLLSANVLNEVWPIFHGGEKEHEEYTSTTPGEPSTTTPFPPLADLALKQAVEHCLADDDFEPLETLVDMPGKMDAIIAALFSREMFPESAHTVLATVLQYELKKNGGIVDLSSRCAFAAETICGAVPLLPSDAVKTVNLSGLHTLTTEVIADVLTTFPNLVRFTLLDTNLTNDQIMDLMYRQPKLFFRVHDFVHPALLTHKGPASAFLPNGPPASGLEGLHALHQQLSSGPTPQGFTVIQSSVTDIIQGTGTTIASIPYFHPEKVLRGLTKYLGPLRTGATPSPPQGLPIHYRLLLGLAHFILTHFVTDNSFAQQYIQSKLGPSMALSIATPLEERPLSEIRSTFPEDSEERLRWLHRSIGNVPIRGAYDPLMAHGWVFVLDCDSLGYGGRRRPRYGFVKVDEKMLPELMEATWKAEARENETESETPSMPALPLDAIKVYDVHEFADAVEKEGRPRPSVEVIAGFQKAIGVSWWMPSLFSSWNSFVKMDVESAKEFVPITSQQIGQICGFRC
ncbi:hypothetical protein VNI00_014275 [Paramarasmius palmivorus]|uniref:Uncharacterized protein n=1 Tax=Paramarasmius palmivorus TaxID=297713 RepID=A0AAW0BWH3_9AGAR